MTIGNVGNYGFSVNPYALDRIPKVDPAQVDQLDDRQVKDQQATSKDSQLAQAPVAQDQPVVRKNLPLEDISLTFNRDDTFDMIGSESDLTKLDMDKAISDMQKDQILQDYQYFVGPSQTQTQAQLQSASEDGVVIVK